jgi:hypothetical protein
LTIFTPFERKLIEQEFVMKEDYSAYEHRVLNTDLSFLDDVNNPGYVSVDRACDDMKLDQWDFGRVSLTSTQDPEKRNDY